MRQDGFTLVEVVLTVAILLLVTSSAALSYPRMIASFRMREATTLTVTALREAQIRAVKEGRPWRVLMDADGGGLSLQLATSPTMDPAECSLSGWQPFRHDRFAPSISIDTATMSLPCVTFGPSGRGEWRIPQVDPVRTTTPFYGGGPGLLRLVDGVRIVPPSYPATSDSRIAGWLAGTRTIVIDAGEVRRFDTISIGMYAYPTSIRYPSTVKVEATSMAEGTPPVPPADPALWTVIYNAAGPANPPTGTKATTSFSVTVDNSYRFIRITLTNTSTTILDEIEMSNLYLRLNGHGMARQLVISPVTGRVSVENINL